MNILKDDILHYFIVDTGADVSLVKKGCVRPETLCDPNEKLSVQGISQECIKTLATTTGSILFSNSESLPHKFHVINNEFNIGCSGIIGRDFLEKFKCIVDYGIGVLEIKINNKPFSFDLCSSFDDIQIPGRVEKTMQLKTKGENKIDLFCPSQKIASGVFVASCIINPLNNFATVSVININDFPVDLKNCSIQTETLDDYKIFKINSWSDDIDARFKILESTIQTDHLNNEEKISILNILKQFNDVFHLQGDKLTFTPLLKHKIPIISESQPINKKPYRLPNSATSEINSNIKNLLENDIIEPSTSPWNSPLLVVPKKSTDGTKKFRVVVDFRKLNEITINNIFPLPNITQILDQLGQSNYFSTLDLASGYYQVSMNENDKEKTAFSTSSGHFQFKRMPFGLKGAPGTFQRLMNLVLSGLNGIKCFVYLDDVVVYGVTLDDHNNKLIDVLASFRKHNLKLQPTKCHFLRKEIKYLGHIITKDGTKPDPDIIYAIENFPRPNNVKEIMPFLGLVGYYRQFIKHFADISEPLNALRKKNNKFIWNAFTENSFITLKNYLIKPPILQYPDFSKEFLLTTDASDVALGAVLSQMQDSQDLPISFASRVLNAAEKNYPTVKKELLAIIWAVRRFRPYIYGTKFTIVTDHKPLTFLYSSSNPSSILLRWRLELEEYDFKIIYKPGKINLNADALSRVEIPNENDKSHIMAITRSMANLSNSSIDLNQSDSNLGTILNSNRYDFPISNSNVSSNLSNNNLQNQSQSNIKEINDLNEINKLLHDFHISPLGGHMGVSRTIKRLKKYYKFQNMVSIVQKFIQNCPQCQKNKHGKKIRIPMKITTTSSQPFEKIFMDIVGPINPPSHNGNSYILTMQDDLSKFSVAVPLNDQESSTISKAFVIYFVCCYGLPSIIVTDQGRNFISNLFKQVCKLLKIEKLNCTAYHPQSNGALERSHRTLGDYLRSYTEKDPQNWDEFVPFAMFAYNSTPHSSTNYMPFELLYGTIPNIPNSIKSGPDPLYNFDDYSCELKYRLQTAWKIAKDKLIDKKEKSKKQYDDKVNYETFDIGEKVLLRNETGDTKTKSLWLGPFVILKIPSLENSTIKIKNKEVTVHNNRLKRFCEKVNESNE